MMPNSEQPTPSTSSEASSERDARFVQLFAQNQQRIAIYLKTLVPDQSAADDIFQETMLVLWREFDRFEHGTNFVAWSCTVALNQVRAWRKKQQRDRLQFSDEFLEALAHDLDAQEEQLHHRYQLLNDCLADLPDHHRQLIAYRYSAGQAVDEIAKQTQRSIDAVYRLLSRVRNTLQQCVDKKLIAEETA
ncbi:sigma-70 family RNA polymerase sigma factor [Bremerella sp. JC817]|uniref:sigma-70 family RNA polymerase sigma factor n=1 Tax=Bremerella sp. JC817 TaxID=3231756 RepID=UPI00345B0E53